MNHSQSKIKFIFLQNTVKNWKYKIELFIAGIIHDCNLSNMIIIPEHKFLNE